MVVVVVVMVEEEGEEEEEVLGSVPFTELERERLPPALL